MAKSLPVYEVIGRALEATVGALQITGRKGARAEGRVQPDTSATLIVAANTGRATLVMTNVSANTVYLGKSDVDTTKYPLAQGEHFTDNSSTEAWYGITATGTGDIRYIEV